MSTNMTMQKSPNRISKEMSEDAGMHQACSSQLDHLPAITYRDAKGAIVTEAACARCLERFTWTNEHRSCIAKALELIALLEEFEVDRWLMLTGSCSSHDRDDLRRILQMKRGVEEASGFYALDFRAIRAIHGALLIAMALKMDFDGEPDIVTEVLNQITDFHAHLHNHHRRTGTPTIPIRILQELNNPLYEGHCDLAQVVQFSDKLSGRTLEQIETWCQQQLDGLLEEARGNIAKSHGGRPGSAPILQAALWNAVDSIESQAADWTEQARNSTCCEDFLHVAQAVHEQVFLIDELMGLGCTVTSSTNGCERLTRSLGSIASLIDWDECANLSQVVELPVTDDSAECCSLIDRPM